MAAIEIPTESPWRPRLWRRTLDHYPRRRSRVAYLAIVIAITMVLYYELYVTGGVATLQLRAFHMSFGFYTFFIAASNLFSAFGALTAGLCDRFGRANLVVYGLLATGLLILVAVPNAPDKIVLAVETCLVGGVEGIVLVATPALIRDFSPQVGRATAMGFWLLGPVLGSLVVSVVAAFTLPVLHTWQSQYHVCGVIGLVTFGVSLLWLREPSPRLRDQVMVTEHDRVLVEARARGIDVAEALRHPWRQMARVRIVLPAFGFAVAFLMYSTLAGFGTIFFTGVFGFRLAAANGVAVWGWVCDAVLCVGLGVLSDRLRVRKPVVLAGALLMAAAVGVFILLTGGHPGYAAVAAAMAFLAGSLGAFSGAWMAAYTETIEDVNPALTATGLAIWGWLVRLATAGAFWLLPVVVTSVAGSGGGGAAAEWRTWFWICLAAAVVFIPLVGLLKGRWRPAAARADEARHEAEVAEELAALRDERARTG
ncbi:MAG TPA: MFS transporter [Streptosporangiaceae bacterium]